MGKDRQLSLWGEENVQSVESTKNDKPTRSLIEPQRDAGVDENLTVSGNGIVIGRLSESQLETLLSWEENHFLDIKSKSIKPAKLTTTVSAFANADGGEVVIGVAEGGFPSSVWDGFDNPESANGHIQAFENIFPMGDGYSYSFLRHPFDGTVALKVTVPKSRKIVRDSLGGVYIRRSAMNHKVQSDEAMKILERNKGISSYESETVQTGIDRVTESSIVSQFMRHVVPHTEAESWLRKQELIQLDKPTVAGIVLFSDMPQAILPKRSGIKIYRYQTSDWEGDRESLVGVPVTIEGPAYELIKKSVCATEKIIGSIQVWADGRMENVQYPAETLHEVITNAVLHRDYSVADDVHVRIYDNRVEVESPGVLPAHITVLNILTERFSRNGSIVRIINKFPDPPNKDIGEGLNTAYKAMRSMNLKEPVISEGSHSVIVKIYHEKLASAEDAVIQYLSVNEIITNKIARKLTGIGSENKMKKVFSRLRHKNIIEQVPGRTGFHSAWRLVPVEKSEGGEE